ncbi:MAG: glutathione S-transferase [Gammaproteobacteria bacterium]|jgi:glutathione S-transferase
MDKADQTPQITLYGVGHTRSARCRWALLELGLEFDYIEDRSLIRSDKLRALQPLAKLPVIVVDGNVLFESAAICTYLCDLAPQRELVPACGTYARGLHEQWTSFVLTELEAYLWSNAKHSSMYAQELRVPGVIARNNDEITQALAVLDTALQDKPFLLGSQFSVTDIIVGWTVNWARRAGNIGEHPHLGRYLKRLFERELCTFNQQ